MRVVSLLLLSLSLSLPALSSVSAADANACAGAEPYVPVPLNLPAGQATPNPLQNDGMGVFNTTGGWCTSPDTNICPNPLGFKLGSFQPDNDPPFCFQVTGVRNRLVEIMVESVAFGDRVCVTDTSANPIQTQNPALVNLCDNNKVRACFAASSASDVLSISIACADGVSCSTSTTMFWYRVRVSQVDWVSAGASAETARDSANETPDMWCNMIQSREFSGYPSSLAAQDTAARGTTTPPTRKPTPGSTANTHTPTLLTALGAMVAAFFGMQA